MGHKNIKIIGSSLLFRSSCYDGSVLGAQVADQLLHDCINPSWLLESSQHCWLSPTLEDRQRSSPAAADERESSPWEESDSWTEREKSLLDKGIVSLCAIIFNVNFVYVVPSGNFPGTLWPKLDQSFPVCWHQDSVAGEISGTTHGHQQ